MGELLARAFESFAEENEERNNPNDYSFEREILLDTNSCLNRTMFVKVKGEVDSGI
ncbi:hypothetical protein [Flagellimonas alvinocaridis]|uniref:hypothetical protein n=1 Tax=Flagellimonas alvinocaridis TaxID=2530200 RepID=UPI0013760B1E|nr:hypothetical protein [Allomuricauda alvinocaridis]